MIEQLELDHARKVEDLDTRKRIYDAYPYDSINSERLNTAIYRVTMVFNAIEEAKLRLQDCEARIARALEGRGDGLEFWNDINEHIQMRIDS